MSNSVEQQFSELSLSQEDHDQIFEQEDHQDQRSVYLGLELINASLSGQLNRQGPEGHLSKSLHIIYAEVRWPL